jgi:hypothetical protein
MECALKVEEAYITSVDLLAEMWSKNVPGTRTAASVNERLQNSVPVSCNNTWERGSSLRTGGHGVHILSTCYSKKGPCSSSVWVFMCRGAVLGPPGTYTVHHPAAHLAQTFACSVKIYRQPLPLDSLLQIWI